MNESTNCNVVSVKIDGAIKTFEVRPKTSQAEAEAHVLAVNLGAELIGNAKKE